MWRKSTITQREPEQPTPVQSTLVRSRLTLPTSMRPPHLRKIRTCCCMLGQRMQTNAIFLEQISSHTLNAIANESAQPQIGAQSPEPQVQQDSQLTAHITASPPLLRRRSQGLHSSRALFHDGSSTLIAHGTTAKHR